MLIYQHIQPPAAAVATYLDPYVASGNFSGVVLVTTDGHPIYESARGFADLAHRVPNTVTTRFHLASVSMQFTATAVLRLVDRGTVDLDAPVGALAANIPGAQPIRIRDLLAERSGLPDINDLPDYSAILEQHQTPATLVDRLNGQSLLFAPGTRYLHEEHSAYNLLALLVERQTGLPFRAAIERLVLRPAGLRESGADDDNESGLPDVALGYESDGVDQLRPATAIHWSAKTGNASIYATARDESRLVDALVRGHLLRASTRSAMFDTTQTVGYGWLKRRNARFDQMVYEMNGRSPGFSSYVLYLPRDRMTVVVLGNIYSSATTIIGRDIAAIMLGKPYRSFQRYATTRTLRDTTLGTYQFGPDFYVPNAHITVADSARARFLTWPSGEKSPLIPVGPDRFVDRFYWQDVGVERDSTGRAVALNYDRFRGTLLP